MVLVGNDAEIVSKALKFKGKIINISAPKPESLHLLVKDKIDKNNFIDASPQYLREVNATIPSLWKKKPIVK